MSRLQLIRTAFLVVVGAIVLWVIYTVLKRPDPGLALMTITLQPRPTLDPATPTPALINVYVSGAVNQPDVYALPVGSLVKDAVTKAGGATAEADLDHVNLALKLNDQMQVYVPRKGEAVATPKAPSGSATLSAPININTANVEELDLLPGIGPSIAQAIIDYRTQNGPFKTIDDINAVKGIGDALFAKIKDSITVGP
ncbi:MAG: helix-hairpin-helix domain-containing protein [Chloroflexi bacterium]|nr:helix-hairpin-helix domain-containing protein [Chloroflexota bacterium]